jgi:transposase
MQVVIPPGSESSTAKTDDREERLPQFSKTPAMSEKPASLIMVTKDAFDRVCKERDALKRERKDAVRIARQLCKEFGLPLDWPDEIHLGDIIEKQIFRPLDDIFRRFINKQRPTK